MIEAGDGAVGKTVNFVRKGRRSIVHEGRLPHRLEVPGFMALVVQDSTTTAHRHLTPFLLQGGLEVLIECRITVTRSVLKMT